MHVRLGWISGRAAVSPENHRTAMPFFLNNSLGNSRMEPVTSKLAGPAQDNPVTGIRVIDNLPGREVRLPDIRFHPKETVKFSSLYHNFFVLFQRRIYEIYRNYRKFVRAVPEPYQKTVQSLYLYLHWYLLGEQAEIGQVGLLLLLRLEDGRRLLGTKLDNSC